MSHATPAWVDAIESADDVNELTPQSTHTDNHGLRELWKNEACQRVFTAFIREQRGDQFAAWWRGELDSYVVSGKFHKGADQDTIRDLLTEFRRQLRQLLTDGQRYGDLLSDLDKQKKQEKAEKVARATAIGDVGGALEVLASLQAYQRSYGRLFDYMKFLDEQLKWSKATLKGARRARNLNSLGEGFLALGESLGVLKAAIEKWKKLTEGQHRFPNSENAAFEDAQEAATNTVKVIEGLQLRASKVGSSIWSFAEAEARWQFAGNLDVYAPKLAQGQQIANAVSGSLQTALGALGMVFPPAAGAAAGISALTFAANQASGHVKARQALKRDPALVGKILTTKIVPADKHADKITQMMYIGKLGSRYGDAGDQVGNLSSAYSNTQNLSTAASAASSGAVHSVFGGAASALGSAPAAPVAPLLSMAGQTLQLIRQTPKIEQTMPGAAQFIAALDAIRTGAGVTEAEVVFQGVTGDGLYTVTMGKEKLTFDPSTYQIYNLEQTWATMCQNLGLVEELVVWSGNLPNRLTNTLYPVVVKASIYPGIAPQNLRWNAQGSYISALVSVTLEVLVDGLSAKGLPIADSRLLGQPFDWWTTLDTQGSLRLSDMSWIGSSLPTIPTEFLCRTLKTLDDVVRQDVLLDKTKNVFLFYQCAKLTEGSVEGVSVTTLEASQDGCYLEDQNYYWEWVRAAQDELGNRLY